MPSVRSGKTRRDEQAQQRHLLFTIQPGPSRYPYTPPWPVPLEVIAVELHSFVAIVVVGASLPVAFAFSRTNASPQSENLTHESRKAPPQKKKMKMKKRKRRQAPFHSIEKCDTHVSSNLPARSPTTTTPHGRGSMQPMRRT